MFSDRAGQPSTPWLAACGLLVLMLFGGCGDSGNPSRFQEGAAAPDATAEAAGESNSQLSASHVASEPADSGPTAAATEKTGAAAPELVAQRQPRQTTAATEGGAISPAPQTSSAPETIRSGDSSADVLDSGRTLADLLTEIVIPPPWLADVRTSYDTAKPWKEARLEIRRLLGLSKPETHREALKLMWLYLQNGDIGDGHEYPMYTFLGGEPLWSILAHEQFLAKPHENTPIHTHMTLASLYAQYGAFEKAKATLEVALNGLPAPPWETMRRADLLVAFGDLYAAWDRPDTAKGFFQQAVELYPTAKPPYGGHLLPRRAADAQTKLERLTLRSLSSTTLHDGEYRDTALGYAGDIHMTVVIKEGRIADIQLRHEEKIDQNACALVPQWIVEQQTLQVDGVSGATVTRDAIVNGTYRCLQKAGLK